MIAPPIVRPLPRGIASPRSPALPWEQSGGGGGLWTPMAGSTVVDYWDSQYGITLATTKVTDWLGRKDARNLTQGTDANRPVYTASYANFGGKPSLDFATTRFIGGSGFTAISQPYHVIVVVELTAGGSGSEIICDDDGGTADSPAIFYAAATTQWRAAAPSIINTGAIGRTGVKAILFVANGASSRLHVQNDWTTADVTANAGASSTNSLRLGAASTGAGPMTGSIAMVALCSGATHDDNWRAYLVRTYGITVT